MLWNVFNLMNSTVVRDKNGNPVQVEAATERGAKIKAGKISYYNWNLYTVCKVD